METSGAREQHDASTPVLRDYYYRQMEVCLGYVLLTPYKTC